MEAVVHLDRPSVMPSQSSMSYSRSSALHGRPAQNQAELCYKGGPLPGGSSGSSGGGGISAQVGISSAAASGSSQRHSPATYSTNASSYPMRYIHPSYPHPSASAPVSYRENPYSSSRNSGIPGERGQNIEYLRPEGVPNQGKTRISLLTSPEYLASLSRIRLHSGDSYRDSMVPGGVQQMDVAPVKKIRLSENKCDRLLTSDRGMVASDRLSSTLRIDTRTPPIKQEEGHSGSSAYNPQVEAISPTLPSESERQEDANFRATKDDLLHGIAKFDREIAKTELVISKLKKKQQDVEESAKTPVTKTEEEEVPQPKHHSPAQKIYAENRRKAQEAHALLKHLGPTVQLPLYNQPSDSRVYHENKRKHLLFKKRLMLHLRKKHAEREYREKLLTATYSTMVQDWHRRVEKVENSQKRKSKEAKNREFFEKIFPKLRKQREDRERFNRVGARVKSEADLEEIMDGLQEQEMEDKKMRSYAVVPPLLLDAKQRTIFYVNNNGRIDDFPSEYKERHLLNMWTQSEKDLFKEKYLQHPKNFGMIASYLERKSVCDCVQYYYLSKKTENYKRLLRRSRQRVRSGRNPQAKVSSGGTVPSSNSDILATASGVTTRLQREQLQKQEPLQSSSSVDLPPPHITADGPETDQNRSSFLVQSPQPQPPLLIPHTAEKKIEISKDERKDSKNKKKGEDETTDDEAMVDIMAEDAPPHITPAVVSCVICKNESACSRALPRSQASQYGLKEEDIPVDARVCNLCRCKAVRSRFTSCPVPTCSKTQRVKRLRPLPLKWTELPLYIKDQISSEFEINESVTKCCSACYNRIIRRISTAGDINAPAGEANRSISPSSQCSIIDWSNEEIMGLKKGLKQHGIHWTDVAQCVGSTKSPLQCMRFFFKYLKKLGLDQYLPADIKAEEIMEERKPVLTDEEESGSSTSSCSSYGGQVGAGAPGDGGDSDTASAPSPVHPIGLMMDDENKETSITPPPQLIEEGRITITNPGTPERSGSLNSPQGKGSLLPPVLVPNKEDYDSSATETADEGQGGGETESGLAQVPTPKREDEPASPLTVKDLMLNVIEMSLMKPQGQGSSVSNPGGAPTISSILKSEHSNISSYTPRERGRPIDDNLATVSVVGSHHTHQPPPDLPKEGLVVLQVQQALREPREPEGVTLDLSIKKPRDSNAMPSVKSHHHGSSHQSHSMFRVSQPQQQSSGVQQNHENQSSYFHQQILPPPLAPKLSPGVISSAGNTGGPKTHSGSIIHGTPVSSPNIYNQARYDSSQASLIHHTSPHKESGSITQGTPVHQRSPMYANSDYFNKRMQTSSGFYPTRPAAYNVEQRQIIMNDYITSQQMHGPSSSASSRNGSGTTSNSGGVMPPGGAVGTGSASVSVSGNLAPREKLYYQPSTRQGVIQRHNTKPPSPVGVGLHHHQPAPPPPAGYEAFSSLVDVASRQPSLPVPSPLPIPISELKNLQQSEDKRHVHEGLGERFNRDSPHERFSSRGDPDARYMKDTSKMLGQPDRREHPQPTLLQLRDQMSHSSRDTYSQHHMERELQQHQHIQQQLRDQQHREREHHSHQQSQKAREHHLQQQQQQHHQLQHQQHQPQHQHQQQREMEMRVSGQRSMQSYSQRIIHETHHSIDQRIIQVPPFREQPTSSQPSVVSSRSHKQDQSSDGQSNRARSSEGSTLTAASLIDAIITHQINQSSSDTQTTSVSSGTTNTPQTQHTRPGDRLFQSFHRECSESNGKLSPMKANLNLVDNKPPQQHSQHSSPIQLQSLQQQIQPNEHLEIYGSSGSGPVSGMRTSIYCNPGFDHQTWKLRRALQQKGGVVGELPDQGGEKDVESAPHRGGSYYSEPPSLSPLDYVKNRIAEVMRTSEEDGGGGNGGKPPGPDSPVSPDLVSDEMDTTPVASSPYLPPSHTYTYPYSALSISTPSSAPVPLPPQTITKTETMPEPAPILSAQYEPLSDED